MASTMTPLTGSDDSTLFDAFRQGVSVTTLEQQATGLLPRMSAGSNYKRIVGTPETGFRDIESNALFNDSMVTPTAKALAGVAVSSVPITDAGERIIMVPNHEAERRDFGQPKVFKDEEPFEDFQKFNPVIYLQDDNSTLMYPLVLANASMKDPDQFDGVIEPFTLRSRASRLSPELPFFAHDIRASIMSDASECSRLKAIPIVQFIDNEQSSFDYYEDGIENFGAHLMLLDDEDKLVERIGPVYPGYLTQAESVINPFVESSDTEEFRAGLHINEPLSPGLDPLDPGGMKLALEMMSKYEYTRLDGTTGFVSSHSNEDLLSRHHKSSGAGFTFNNNELGTDSLAFGGLLK